MKNVLTALACFTLILSSCYVGSAIRTNNQSIAYSKHLDSHFNLNLGYGEQAENIKFSVLELKKNSLEEVQCFVSSTNDWTNLGLSNPDTLVKCLIYDVFFKKRR